MEISTEKNLPTPEKFIIPEKLIEDPEALDQWAVQQSSAQLEKGAETAADLSLTLETAKKANNPMAAKQAESLLSETHKAIEEFGQEMGAEEVEIHSDWLDSQKREQRIAKLKKALSQKKEEELKAGIDPGSPEAASLAATKMTELEYKASEQKSKKWVKFENRTKMI
ncbi:MAG TPA: hypothetical protein ENN28_02600 [Candidatus Uhrbacteria bacterium]|nr:hypothetical protein [Candidatus Uhrbacteria bacterium]